VKLDLSTGAGKREYSSMALSMINNIVDEVEKAEYERKLAEKLELSEEAVKNKSKAMIEKLKAKVRPKKEIKIAAGAPVAVMEDPILNNILGLYLWHEGLPTDKLAGLDFLTEDGRTLAEMLQNGKTIDKDAGDVYTTAQVLGLRAEERYSVLGDIDFATELESLLKEVEKNRIKKQIDELSTLLREAEELEDSNLVAELQTQKMALKKQSEKLNKE
jgi:DNA primase